MPHLSGRRIELSAKPVDISEKRPECPLLYTTFLRRFSGCQQKNFASTRLRRRPAAFQNRKTAHLSV